MRGRWFYRPAEYLSGVSNYITLSRLKTLTARDWKSDNFLISDYADTGTKDLLSVVNKTINKTMEINEILTV